MSDAEMLIEKIKSLPADRVAQVLDFVEFIRQREACSTESTGDSWFEKGENCPICAKNCNPETGEPYFNTETREAFEEGDAMIRGEIPAKKYHSLDEMLKDLNS